MQQPLNILICEDVKEDLQNLLEAIKACPILTNCTVFSNGEDLIRAYTPQKYDLILSDIYMSKMNGIETIQKIRQIDKNIPVAFVTSSVEFALESYRLSALKYIEKPFQKEAVQDILQLALLQKLAQPSLKLQKNGKENSITFSSILYFEQHSHKLTIHYTNHSSEEFYEKLSNILSQLPEKHFFHCHKSYCVNLAYVRHIDSEVKCFVMEDMTNVPIRRESFVLAKSALANYLFESTRLNL